MAGDIYQELTQICLETLHSGTVPAAEELLNRMMDHPDVPMHYPYHHFIMPAALLTLAAMETGKTEAALEKMLAEAKKRALQIPGGFCGLCGTCGAGTGAGIFMSIFTKTTPKSVETWKWCNELTGRCLQRIASVEGPRCCKRVSYLSAAEAVPYVNEKLGLHLRTASGLRCKYHGKNPECRGAGCPYFPQ